MDNPDYSIARHVGVGIAAVVIISLAAAVIALVVL